MKKQLVKNNVETIDTSFEQMKEGFQKNNDAAVDAQTEEKTADAPVSNKTGVAKRLAERTTAGRAGSAKLTPPKKKVYQTGINTTVENARKANKALDTFVPAYVSPIPELGLPALDGMYIEAKRLEKEVGDTNSKHTVNLNKRATYYKGLNTFGSQIVNMIKACGADKDTLEDARKCLKKMQGVRIIPINPNRPQDKHISAAHTGFEDKLELFGDLIEIAANYVGYAVVTGRLSEAAIRTHYAALNDANDAADTSEAEADAARRVRNAYFNTDITGLVDTYQRVKSNVKAEYGTTSAEYKAISGLAFTRIQE